MFLHNRFFSGIANFLKDPEKLASVIVGVIGCAAIVGALTLKGYTVENTLDALKDIAGLGAIFVTIGFVVKSVGPRTRAEAAESALRKLQTQFSKNLTGPTCSARGQKKKAAVTDRDNTEEDDDTLRYLFFNDENGKNKVKLIPLKPLEDGEIEIAVSGTTLLALHFKHEMERLKRCQEAVAKAVTAELERILREKDSVKASAADPAKHDDLPERCAIILHIGNEVDNSRFERIILAAGRTAVESLLQFKVTEAATRN